MKYILLAFLVLTIPPVFAQEPIIGDYLEPSNQSLSFNETEIPYSDFNKVLRDIRDGNLASLSFIEPSIIKLCAV